MLKDTLGLTRTLWQQSWWTALGLQWAERGHLLEGEEGLQDKGAWSLWGEGQVAYMGGAAGGDACTG